MASKRVFAAVALLVAGWRVGCALPDDFVKVDAVATTTSGAGGSGVGGGNGGNGGDEIMCDDTPQNACVPVDVLTYVGGGEVTVTDMVFVADSAASVGTFTGTIDLGGGQLSTAGTSGFLVEHNATTVVGQRLIEEATEGSVLRVAYNATLNELAVGGSYGPGGPCGGQQGVFIRHLEPNGTNFTDVHPPVCQEVTGVMELTAVGLSDAGYVIVGGSLDGTIDGLTSDGVDGFTFTVDPNGINPDTFLLGGTGDAAIRAIIPNEVDTNQWVYAGDFDGQLRVVFPSVMGPVSETRNASGDRDLFIIAIDRYDQSPNLDVRTMGATAGDHRMVALVTNPAVVGQMHVAASIDGTLDVGPPSNSVPVASDTRPTAMVLTFVADADDGGTTNYDYVHHALISADTLDVRDMVGAQGRYFVGGHARGDIAVTLPAQGPDVVTTALACLNDAFIMVIEPANSSMQTMRCGDGSQQFQALARYSDTLFAASMMLPADASIDFGLGSESGATQRTLLLRQPPQ